MPATTVIELTFASGEDSLSVRSFVVREAMSEPFRIDLVAVSPHENLDLEALVGAAVSLRVTTGTDYLLNNTRLWTGVCRSMKHVRAEPTGLSTYELTLVPVLWLLTKRRNNRLFQHVSIPDILDKLLAEWSIRPVWRITREAYPDLELRVQYDESDYAFFSRLLEEAGISFYFKEDGDRGTVLVLDDRPHETEIRGGAPLPYHDDNSLVKGKTEHVTEVHVGQVVRPGRYTVRDHDFRNPSFALFSDAPAAPPEDRYEQYRYLPGSFLIEYGRSGDDARGRGAPSLAETAQAAGRAAELLGRTSSSLAGSVRSASGTPVADDKGVARFDKVAGTAFARRQMEGDRASRRRVSFVSNALDLRPGLVLRIGGHPREDLGEDRKLLVVGVRIEGGLANEVHVKADLRFAALPYLPAMRTKKPKIAGPQSAIVVGPPGEEIYTDEFGRVRVQFHWDREGRMDPDSSMWMRVSQGWAGGGFGMFTVPRVGHEVLVAFLDGDPDAPIIVGRVHNATAQVPYKLPENRTVSTWKSQSSPGAGGFNEIRFDDAKGREHVYLQAERDLAKQVKNNELAAVGNNRTQVVQRSETISVGHDRSKVVQHNETEATGMNRTVAVGLSRSATVGIDDSTLVGAKWSVTVGRGLATQLTKGLAGLMEGTLGSILHSPVGATLGLIAQMPLGVTPSAMGAHGPLSSIGQSMPDVLRKVASVIGGFRTDPGPPPTTIEMVDRKITLSTGEASIVLDGPNITLSADGNIMLHARKNLGALADGEGALAAQNTLLMLAKQGDAIVQGKTVQLNPYVDPGKPIPPPDAPMPRYVEVSMRDNMPFRLTVWFATSQDYFFHGWVSCTWPGGGGDFDFNPEAFDSQVNDGTARGVAEEHALGTKGHSSQQKQMEYKLTADEALAARESLRTTTRAWHHSRYTIPLGWALWPITGTGTANGHILDPQSWVGRNCRTFALEAGNNAVSAASQYAQGSAELGRFRRERSTLEPIDPYQYTLPMY
jgi:type VI secretion system secreted protein VgrG